MGFVEIATTIVLDDADAFTLVEALEAAGDEASASAAAQIQAAIDAPPLADPVSLSAAERKALLRAVDDVISRPIIDELVFERLRRTLLEADG